MRTYIFRLVIAHTHHIHSARAWNITREILQLSEPDYAARAFDTIDNTVALLDFVFFSVFFRRRFLSLVFFGNLLSSYALQHFTQVRISRYSMRRALSFLVVAFVASVDPVEQRGRVWLQSIFVIRSIKKNRTRKVQNLQQRNRIWAATCKLKSKWSYVLSVWCEYECLWFMDCSISECMSSCFAYFDSCEPNHNISLTGRGRSNKKLITSFGLIKQQ